MSFLDLRNRVPVNNKKICFFSQVTFQQSLALIGNIGMCEESKRFVITIHLNL